MQTKEETLLIRALINIQEQIEDMPNRASQQECVLILKNIYRFIDMTENNYRNLTGRDVLLTGTTTSENKNS